MIDKREKGSNTHTHKYTYAHTQPDRQSQHMQEEGLPLQRTEASSVTKATVKVIDKTTHSVNINCSSTVWSDHITQILANREVGKQNAARKDEKSVALKLECKHVNHSNDVCNDVQDYR